MEKEQNLQEIEPVSVLFGAATIGLGAAIIMTAARLVALLLQTAVFSATAKQIHDKVLTKEINKILGKTKWKVMIIKDKSPNAFVVGPRVIMITTGLKKMLTHRELIGVMLHEAWHVKAFHVYKQIFYKFPLLAAVFTAAIATVMVGGGAWLALLIFVILRRVTEIPYDLTVGRRQETKSDSYAVKMGYGKELASALSKLEKTYLKGMKNCVGVCKIVSKIDEAIDEHPPLKKRIEKILKDSEMVKALASRNAAKIKKIVIKGFKGFKK